MIGCTSDISIHKYAFKLEIRFFMMTTKIIILTAIINNIVIKLFC